MTTSWADEPLDTLPIRRETVENGLHTVVEIYLNEDGKRVKRTTQSRQQKKTVRVNKRVEERKHWAPFGAGLEEDKEKSVTTLATEDIFVEKPQKRGETKKKEDDTQKICNFATFHDRLAARKLGQQLDSSKPITPAPSSEANPAVKSDKYVPPSLRAGAGQAIRDGSAMRQRDDTNTLRVTNLPDDVVEEDLGAMFRQFGHVIRIYLARDRVTQDSRGFAFVNYTNREDAERAIAKLNGFGYQNMILHVEWSQGKS
eukprot:c14573_g1_i1.p1 GENE.c14573_g1_i1~~c14573_g1_i1.p1  ORF type:complete len:257 (+),score=53.41 c14573_g1_i1:86-856(+)